MGSLADSDEIEQKMSPSSSLLSAFKTEFEFNEIPVKKSKYGRPKKLPAFSSFRCYEERDIEFFLHQISNNEPIYNRKLNYGASYVHGCFDKIESSCQFLSRKNGENASRLWTELASEYKREKARIENLPSGHYTTDFEPKFPFLQLMWFMDAPVVQPVVDLKISSESSPETSSIPQLSEILANSASSSRKRPLEGCSNDPIERLDESINRLIDVIDGKRGKIAKNEEKNGYSDNMPHADLVDHVLKFFEKAPRDKHLEYKCKIVMFLESLKNGK